MPFRPANVAKAIYTRVVDYFAHKLRAKIAKPFKRFVYVAHCEHDPQIAESVNWSVAMICNDGGCQEAG